MERNGQRVVGEMRRNLERLAQRSEDLRKAKETERLGSGLVMTWVMICLVYVRYTYYIQMKSTINGILYEHNYSWGMFNSYVILPEAEGSICLTVSNMISYNLGYCYKEKLASG